MGIRTIHILRSIIRPLCHQDVMIIICKGLCGVWHELINSIGKNADISAGVFSNPPEEFFIEVLVLHKSNPQLAHNRNRSHSKSGSVCNKNQRLGGTYVKQVLKINLDCPKFAVCNLLLKTKKNYSSSQKNNEKVRFNREFRVFNEKVMKKMRATHKDVHVFGFANGIGEIGKKILGERCQKPK